MYFLNPGVVRVVNPGLRVKLKGDNSVPILMVDIVLKR